MCHKINSELLFVDGFIVRFHSQLARAVCLARNVVVRVTVHLKSAVIRSQGIACVPQEDWENAVSKVR